MSGGRLQVDLLPAGAVVGAFQVLDGVNDGVIDAAHTVPVYWYGKHKARVASSAPARCSAARPTTMLAWFYQGGGAGVLPRADPGHPRAQRLRLLRLPDAGAAVRLVQGADHRRRRHPGLQVPHRRPRRRPDAADGHERRPAAGRRDRAGDGARRDRRLRVQQPVLGPALRLGRRGEELLPRLLPPGVARAFEFLFNRDFFDDLEPDLQAILQARRRGGLDAPTPRFALNNYSADLQKLQNELGVTVHRTPHEILERAARGLGQADPDARGGRVHEARASTASAPGSSASPTTS